ncbi:MAG: sel1 repeat family protein [Magnetococcales bacterium]|nr:sel1 repeat family protein [Magnetococcales bacterium]
MILRLKILPSFILLACLGVAITLSAQSVSANTAVKDDVFVTEYLKRAQNGEIRAQLVLGNLFLHGEGIFQKPENAFKWFHQAALNGDKLAQFNLGTLYQEGVGTIVDNQKALKWFLKVVEPDTGGDKTGLSSEILAWTHLKLGLIYYEGNGTPVNYTEAMKWFKIASYNNHAFGQYMTGLMYGAGRGVEKDDQLAIYWLKTAADQGFESAKAALKPYLQERLENQGSQISLYPTLAAL